MQRLSRPAATKVSISYSAAELHASAWSDIIKQPIRSTKYSKVLNLKHNYSS
jgi:hypothetical protein